MIVSLYVAMSQDGFIADKDGGVEWLDSINQEAFESEGYGREDHEKYIDSIDAVIIGRTTYIQMIGFGDLPYKNKVTYVIGSEKVKSDHEGVIFIKSIDEFLSLTQQQNIQKTWLLGGAKLIDSFLQRGLIDEYIITVIPLKLGQGIQLPQAILNQIDDRYIINKYPNGLLQYKF